MAKKDPVRRQVLRVKGCLAGAKAEKDLEQGDMLLAIDGKPITCFKDIEDACNILTDTSNMGGKLKMTVFRQVTSGIGTRRLSCISVGPTIVMNCRLNAGCGNRSSRGN